MALLLCTRSTPDTVNVQLVVQSFFSLNEVFMSLLHLTDLCLQVKVSEVCCWSFHETYCRPTAAALRGLNLLDFNKVQLLNEHKKNYISHKNVPASST